jgi:hypothetical protein
VRYTEFTVFRHLALTKGNPPPVALARELVRFARAIYRIFERAATKVRLDGRSSAHTPPAPQTFAR